MDQPARRQRLAELDALTAQIGPLLDRLDAIWRRVEAYRAVAPADRSPVRPSR